MTGRIKGVRLPKAPFLHSVRFRLTLWFMLILALVLAAFSGFIYLSQKRDLQGDAVSSMQEKLNRLQIYFRSTAWQNSNIAPSDLPGSSAPLQKADVLLLADTEGHLVESLGSGAADADATAASLVAAARVAREPSIYQRTVTLSGMDASPARREYLFAVIPLVRGDLWLGYLIVGSPSPLKDQLQRLIVSLLLGGLGTLAVAFIGGVWLADRAMRPVKVITQTARTIGESDLSRRLNITGRDELAELAGTFDAMLARLQMAFDRQRRFVADASHELRTPLTIINLEVDRALSGNRSIEEYQHALSTVDAESDRMTRLVTDLMLLARMDAGQTTLSPEPLDLSEIAVQAVERMGSLASRQGVSIETGELPELSIEGDRQYLVQMVSNLLENAIKYGGSGKTVRIATRAGVLVNHPAGILSVSDNGPGIPPAHIERIFDRFYRVDAARSRDDDEAGANSGTGLGLSIVAGIAQLHGGTVKATSRLQGGSTFEVCLPLVTTPS